MAASGPLDDKRHGRVCVGQITGARGLKGELFVRSFTADPRAVAEYGPLASDAGQSVLRLRVVGTAKKALVVRAEGINDRSAAKALRGVRLYLDRAKLPAPAKDEYYHADLIGLEAELAGGDDARPRRLGAVVAVHDFGAGTVLEIEAAGSPPLLVPFTKAAIPEIDIEGGRVVIAPLPGLFGWDSEPGADAGEV